MRLSLRARLLAGMALTAAVLAFAAVAITRSTERHLVSQVDEQLRSADRPLRDARVGRPGNDVGGPERLSSLYAAFVSGDGEVTVLFTPNLRNAPPPLPSITAGDALDAAATGRTFTAGSSGETRYRVLASRAGPNGGVVVLALPLSDVDAAVSRLVAVEVLATLAVLGVLALVTWWVIHLGVRPIKQMTATASAIAGGQLSHRVPDVALGTEAGDLGLALNQMLGRIEAAFDERTRSEDRLRRFVADASHELRTPVTTIRGYAELFRHGGLDEPAELREAMRRTEQEALRMGTLVDDLLHLARLDQGRPLEQGPVDLAQIADDAARDARAVDPTRSIAVGAPEPVVVVGDESRLRQVVANILGNALVHTPPGTAIEVRAHTDEGWATVDVIDHGPGMPPEVADRAFERFFRADPARSRHHGGSGLGLAIVEATVAAHGGRVSLASSVGAGTTVRVQVPLATPTSR